MAKMKQQWSWHTIDGGKGGYYILAFNTKASRKEFFAFPARRVKDLLSAVPSSSARQIEDAFIGSKRER